MFSIRQGGVIAMRWNQSVSGEIFKDKYCLQGENSPEEVFQGVAKEISHAEKCPLTEEKMGDTFFQELLSTRFIPGGRILANARPNSLNKNYNNCFTIDVEDSLDGIYHSLSEDARISKAGGGVGFNISKLRPKNQPLSKGGISSGPISFLKVFNESAKIIMTGGYRRSAHIAILNIDHPDIEEFITIKKGSQNKELTQFNLSVGITDKFMDCVEKNLPWELQWGGTLYKTVPARGLFHLLMENAYAHNEPGVLFLDTVERYNNGYWAFSMDRTNPCGEICMPSYSLCCLGSLNLTAFVNDAFGENPQFDFNSFKLSIYRGVRFLDNVLDVTDYPLKKVEDFSKQWRRIGLGVTGLGDTFAMMKMVYGSEESLLFTEEIGKYLRDNAYLQSIALAAEKGSFPSFDKKILNSGFIKTLPEEIQLKIEEYGLRNIGLLTCAPTGTTSLSVGQNCSSGIEPIFALQYDRHIRTGREDESRSETVYDYAFLKWKEKFPDSKTIPYYFVTTENINPYNAIKVQATLQKYIDHSISKTVNLPKGYSFEEYANLWEFAFKSGLKGFTSFNPEGCCSVDTKVYTSNGLMSFGKIMKDQGFNLYDYSIKPGWYTLEKPLQVYDGEGNLQDVKKLFIKGIASEMWEITIEGGDYLTITPEHKFLGINNKWISVSNLEIGDSIGIYTKDRGVIFKKIKSISEVAHQLAVDIEVEPTHSYLMGKSLVISHNSIKGVLEYSQEKTRNDIDMIERHHAPKRPQELLCDIHEITIQKNKYVVAIGTYFGSLYEIFLVPNSEHQVNIQKHHSGIIRKIQKGRYDLIIKNGEDKVLIEDISKYSGDIYGSLSRMISMALRHGTPLEFIVETLQKSSSFNDFERVVARVLKKYIKDGERVQSNQKCSTCGGSLVFENGCKVCKTCGMSSCS